MKLKIGVFASHGGSNLQAIIDGCANNEINGEVCVVISNNSKAKVVKRAERAGIPIYHISSNNYPDPLNLEEAILLVLKKHKVNIIALAGYMKKLGTGVLNEYKNRIINIHPSLLPKYGGKGMYGLNVHKAVLESGDVESGATVHLVSDKYDEGRLLSYSKITVSKKETPETLAAKVLEKEHKLYVKTLDKIARREIII